MNITFVTLQVLAALGFTIPCSFYGGELQKIGYNIELVYMSLSPEFMKTAQGEDIPVKSLGSSFSFPQIQIELLNIS
jgi:hypothetical protein